MYKEIINKHTTYKCTNKQRQTHKQTTNKQIARHIRQIKQTNWLRNKQTTDKQTNKFTKQICKQTNIIQTHNIQNQTNKQTQRTSTMANIFTDRQTDKQ